MRNTKKKNNKKILIIILLVIALVGAIVAIAVSQATKLTNDSFANCAVGDINGDGYINSNDVLAIRSALISETELFETQRKNGDVNADGELTEQDAKIILRYITGDITKLPYTDSENDGISDNDKLIRHTTEDSETTVKVINTWANGDGTYSYQLNINIRNLSSSGIRGWETEITLNDEAEISKNWDCECRIKGETLIIEGETIPEGTVGVCGVIITADKNLKLESVVTTE